MKESGIGREGSSYGVDDWVELKYLAMGGMGSRLRDRSGKSPLGWLQTLRIASSSVAPI